MKQQSLSGYVILITGANRGIGKALSLLCASLGAEVILVGKSVKGLEAVYDEICEQGYKEPAIYPINLMLATPEHMLELINNIDSIFGKLDVLVHNAGMTGPLAPIEHVKPSDWQQVIQLNLNVPFLLTHSLLPLLKKSPHGRILFPIPVEAEEDKAFWGAYAASKAGVMRFAKTLNTELKNSSVKSCCVHLPKAQTDLTLKAYPGLSAADFCSAHDAASLYLPHILTSVTEDSLIVS